MAAFASVMRDGDEIRMYYSGKDQAGRGQVGLAVSTDGKRWTKHPANPVLKLGEPGQWDDTNIWCPTVWKEAGYHMLYTGRNADGVLQIGYATSDDGVAWTKHPRNPVFNDPTWAHDHTEGYGVIKVGGEYLLWYNTLYVSTRQTGLARSTDLLHWTPVSEGPLFVHAKGTGRHHQFCASPFRRGAFFYLMIPSQDKTRNFATIDLWRCADPYFRPADREFVKQVLMPGPHGRWDSRDLDTAILLTDDITRSTFYRGQFWLYYSGEGGENIWRQGLAIEPDIDRALFRPIDTDATTQRRRICRRTRRPWTNDEDATRSAGSVECRLAVHRLHAAERDAARAAVGAG